MDKVILVQLKWLLLLNVFLQNWTLSKFQSHVRVDLVKGVFEARVDLLISLLLQIPDLVVQITNILLYLLALHLFVILLSKSLIASLGRCVILRNVRFLLLQSQHFLLHALDLRHKTHRYFFECVV